MCFSHTCCKLKARQKSKSTQLLLKIQIPMKMKRTLQDEPSLYFWQGGEWAVGKSQHTAMEHRGWPKSMPALHAPTGLQLVLWGRARLVPQPLCLWEPRGSMQSLWSVCTNFHLPVQQSQAVNSQGDTLTISCFHHLILEPWESEGTDCSGCCNRRVWDKLSHVLRDPGDPGVRLDLWWLLCEIALASPTCWTIHF